MGTTKAAAYVAVRGFNHGPDDVRVEPEARIAEGELPADVAELLLASGAIRPVRKRGNR